MRRRIGRGDKCRSNKQKPCDESGGPHRAGLHRAVSAARVTAFHRHEPSGTGDKLGQVDPKCCDGTAMAEVANHCRVRDFAQYDDVR